MPLTRRRKRDGTTLHSSAAKKEKKKKKTENTNKYLNRVLQGEDSAFGLSLITNVRVFLPHAHHDTFVGCVLLIAERPPIPFFGLPDLCVVDAQRFPEKQPCSTISC